MSFTESKNEIIRVLNNIDSNQIDDCVKSLSTKILHSFSNKGKVLICGNGGSAAEAEHFAAELVCKFKKVRQALPALALHSNIPTVTAISNDFNFEDIFSRNLQALGNKSDILVVMSTSGNSQNIINVLQSAKKMGIYTFALLGKDGGKIKSMPDDSYIVDSNIVSTIQEIHLMFLHALCMEIEKHDF